MAAAPRVYQARDLTFLDESVSMVARQLGQSLAGPGEPAFHVQRVSNLNWAARDMKEDRAKSQARYPIIGLAIESLGSSSDFRWNEQALYNGLYYTDPNQPGKQFRARLAYVRVELMAQITSNDGPELLKMIQRWKMAERRAQFSLKDSASGFSAMSMVLYNDSFQYPSQQDNPGDGTLFAMQSPISLYTYVGVIEELEPIRGVSLEVWATPDLQQFQKTLPSPHSPESGDLVYAQTSPHGLLGAEHIEAGRNEGRNWGKAPGPRLRPFGKAQNKPASVPLGRRVTPALATQTQEPPKRKQLGPKLNLKP